MTPKRKKVQERVLSVVKDLDSTGTNTEYYTQLFAKLSDKDFDDYIHHIL